MGDGNFREVSKGIPSKRKDTTGEGSQDGNKRVNRTTWFLYAAGLTLLAGELVNGVNGASIERSRSLTRSGDSSVSVQNSNVVVNGDFSKNHGGVASEHNGPPTHDRFESFVPSTPNSDSARLEEGDPRLSSGSKDLVQDSERSNGLEVSRSMMPRDTSSSGKENLSERELGANDVKPIMDLICKKLEQVDTWASQNPEVADKMLKYICDHPDQLEEWIDRNPKAAMKVIEHGIDAISRHQEMQKFEIEHKGSKPGEQLSGKLVRRDAIDQGLQNQIEILRDRVSSAEKFSIVAAVSLSLGAVLATAVGYQIFYNNPAFTRAIATLDRQQRQNFLLPPAGPAQNAQ